MKKVTIYTDGACRGNPGPGGYGTILIYNGREKELSGGERLTTNNRMEIMAVIVGLEILKESCEVQIISDSKYVVDAMEKGWVTSWQKRGWKKSDGNPALNVDLWMRLMAIAEKHMIYFTWVRGHDGNPYNERCDALAVKAAEKAASMPEDD